MDGATDDDLYDIFARKKSGLLRLKKKKKTTLKNSAIVCGKMQNADSENILRAEFTSKTLSFQLDRKF